MLAFKIALPSCRLSRAAGPVYLLIVSFESCKTRTVTVKKPIKLKKVMVDGKKRLEEERIEYAEEQVVVPANVTAQIFYLKNRKPDKWKDKPQENTTEAQNNDMQTLADLLQRPVPDRDIKDFET